LAPVYNFTRNRWPVTIATMQRSLYNLHLSVEHDLLLRYPTALRLSCNIERSDTESQCSCTNLPVVLCLFIFFLLCFSVPFISSHLSLFLYLSLIIFFNFYGFFRLLLSQISSPYVPIFLFLFSFFNVF
jgi:hypothetical protein